MPRALVFGSSDGVTRSFCSRQVGVTGRALRETHHSKQPEGPERPALDQFEIIADHDAGVIKHRPPSQLIRKRRHAPLDPTSHAVVPAEMVDEDYLAARLAHPGQLAHHLLWVWHYRHDVHCHDYIERAAGKGERPRIHLVQPPDMAKSVGHGAGARLVEHFWRQVDANDLQVLRVHRERKPGADADFEDTALFSIDDLNRMPASLGRKPAERLIIDRRPATVGVSDRRLIQFGG